MPDYLTLQVVTPERQLLSEAHVGEVQIPGLNGYLGILPGHAPLITELGIGELSYRKGKDTYYATIIRGFAEVLPDRVAVLTEIGERAEEIDVDRARAARERAEKFLAGTGEKDIDWDRAAVALQRALIRLQVAAKGGAVAAQAERQPAP
ncbi:MAG TPA: F0F1 ATP synthase subunit epsilon [Candidatus Acidoferrales bacterium]|jgi:F-type H+-transporting ATPase subunit epsilon|nr:F0F1 ATP synthase subunit epsilon [Candidatus Acidoferrales bacterium]